MGLRFATTCLLVLSLATGSTGAKVLVVAHRGCRIDYPENTLVCFEHALRQGVDWIETDSWLSLDGVPMLHHDKDLCRTTNIEDDPTYDCSVPENNPLGRFPEVGDFTVDELKLLDVGSWLDPAFEGTRMPTFEEALQLVDGTGTPLLVEVKDLGQAPVIRTILEGTGIGVENVIIWNRNHSWTEFKAEMPDARRIRGLYEPNDLTATEIAALAADGEFGVAAISPGFTHDFVESVETGGLLLYSIPSPTGAMSFLQQIDMGVRALHSTDADALLALVASLPCVDGLDNDGDGLVDFDGYDGDLDGVLELDPDDGCLDRLDDRELPQCMDGLDNDDDAFFDYPSDLGCTKPTDLEEIGPFAGRLPDGRTVPGRQLELTRLPGGELRLSFGFSCSSEDTDFGVFEGELGTFFSHVPIACTTSGQRTHTLQPGAGDRYYVVVPRRQVVEGSHGADSAGEQRAEKGGCAPLAFESCGRVVE